MTDPLLSETAISVAPAARPVIPWSPVAAPAMLARGVAPAASGSENLEIAVDVATYSVPPEGSLATACGAALPNALDGSVIDAGVPGSEPAGYRSTVLLPASATMRFPFGSNAAARGCCRPTTTNVSPNVL